MNNKQVNDSIFEALFRQAVVDDYTDEIDSIPPNEELAKTLSFSPGFELKMKKVFARDRRKDIFTAFIKHTKRVAVFVLILTTLLSGALLAHPEVRAAVGNVIVQWFEKFTSFTYHSGVSEEDSVVKHFRPQFLPNGFSESEALDLESMMLIIYSDGSDGIIYLQYSLGDDTSMSVAVDNEYTEIKEVIMYGSKALIITDLIGDGMNGVVFMLDGYVINIKSNLPIDVVVQIAESVAEIKIGMAKLRPLFLPGGYVETSVTDLKNLIIVIFTNDTDKEIRISYSRGENTSSFIGVDNEHNTVENYAINGIAALLITAHDNEEPNGIVFVYDGHLIDIRLQ